ncbi:hypothetical protein STSC103643_06435 [Staphylococcus schleiferi subsp. schleiferi]|uniref:Uncharacterized protein n=1 Tax=Staphylococcus schleiferi TaxID=1295 RepID=A0A7Z7QPP7_STASC|nr:Uncharacterised protein [Staphylococcus schleiferi]SUM88985.1 Uncharacterised protein [Staphylococcus schleiferi]
MSKKEEQIIKLAKQMTESELKSFIKMCKEQKLNNNK